MSLYIKYRPMEFMDVVGNSGTVNALEELIKKKNPPHALLFFGPSGCGKTTLARITARDLGCADMDIMELNTANFRGIDTSREIIQQMRLAPLGGGARAWLLDESHKLTVDAQTALLKALEDTPPHVYFLLATTDPQKLLPTIRNRCTSFPVVLLSEDRVIYLLRDILKKEKKKIPDTVLEQIAQNCLGSPRAALVMLDKVIDLPERRMLRAVSQVAEAEHTVLELCRALVNGSKWKSTTKILKALSDQEPEQIRMAILGYCKSVLLNDENDRAFLVMDSFKEPFFNSGFAGLVRACYEALCK